MDKTYEKFAKGFERIVYVKSVDVADLPKDVRDQAGDLEELYSVHNSHGEQIALVAHKELAYALARQHDLAPVQCH